MKSQGTSTVIRIHLLGTLNVNIWFHVNSFLKDFILTKSNGPTNITIPRNPTHPVSMDDG